jgi:hypothetical protein
MRRLVKANDGCGGGKRRRKAALLSPAFGVRAADAADMAQLRVFVELALFSPGFGLGAKLHRFGADPEEVVL